MIQSQPRKSGFNTIVLGLGAAGSAALYQLARRGDTVLGIDRYSPPHALGSTHGDTRITRQAIGEGEHYTPFALRSYELVRQLEKESGKRLLLITGGLMISSESRTGIMHVPSFFENSVRAADRFGIKHDLLDAGGIRKRFPQFNVQNNEKAYYEYESGILFPEECLRAQLALATSHGAEIHTNETVLGFEPAANRVIVRTDRGRYECGKLVISAGPWLPQLLPDLLPGLLRVHRQVLYWFDIQDGYDLFAPGRFPVYIWELSGRQNGIYGFPAIDGAAGGIKIATEDYGQTTAPDTVKRNVSDDEITCMFDEYVAPSFPAIGRHCVKSAVCLYTVTPDAGFIVDSLPECPSVIVCLPCSGHGFKHSPAIGECIADLVLEGSSRLDISAFSISRPTLAPCSA